ncbi:hypothetical protein PCANC_15224 [Puccinia coronata f. sp. avenae]|uniref:Uncharacterized protein n=1 Tax=Puccinia coronata f. sp. avenae TaxID=200324 RepID=A0A2N5VNJ0_9BASI|nr:hypothetical protein PCANC_15224 [Puccinia coronata f. sp. avenae]
MEAVLAEFAAMGLDMPPKILSCAIIAQDHKETPRLNGNPHQQQGSTKRKHTSPACKNGRHNPKATTHTEDNCWTLFPDNAVNQPARQPQTVTRPAFGYVTGRKLEWLTSTWSLTPAQLVENSATITVTPNGFAVILDKQLSVEVDTTNQIFEMIGVRPVPQDARAYLATVKNQADISEFNLWHRHFTPVTAPLEVVHADLAPVATPNYPPIAKPWRTPQRGYTTHVPLKLEIPGLACLPGSLHPLERKKKKLEVPPARGTSPPATQHHQITPPVSKSNLLPAACDPWFRACQSQGITHLNLYTPPPVCTSSQPTNGLKPEASL